MQISPETNHYNYQRTIFSVSQEDTHKKQEMSTGKGRKYLSTQRTEQTFQCLSIIHPQDPARADSSSLFMIKACIDFLIGHS